MTAEEGSGMDPDLLAAYLRPCPSCGAVEAEKCKRVKGKGTGWLEGYVHTARRSPGRAERQREKQATYTARYRAKKAASRPSPEDA